MSATKSDTRSRKIAPASVPIFQRVTGGKWHVRLTIPKNLQSHFLSEGGKPRTELSPVNLDTFDQRDALTKGARVWSEHKMMLEKISKGIADAPSSAKAFRNRYERELLVEEEKTLLRITDAERKLLQKLDFIDLSVKAGRSHPSGDPQGYQKERETRDRQLAIVRLKRFEVLEDYGKLKVELLSDDFSPVFEAEAEDFLKTVPERTETSDRERGALLKSIRDTARSEALSIISGAMQTLQDTGLMSVRVATAHQENTTDLTPELSLSMYYETHIKPSATIKTARGIVGLTPSGFEMYKEGVRHFSDLMGDLNIGEITNRHVKTFCDLYRNVPTNWIKRKEFKDKPLSELIEIANSTSPAPNRLSPETVNSVLTGLRGVFAIAVKKEHIRSNPATGVSVPVSNDKDRDPAITVDQLNSLFSSPLFVGCASDREFEKPGHLLIRDHRYWAHFCLLFTGARVGEMGGIQTQQVVIKPDLMGGYFEFDWTSGGGGRSIKNPSSVRRVPIHPELIKLGFIEYVEKVRAEGHERLFPNWIPNLRKHELGVSNQYSSCAWIKRLYRSPLWSALKSPRPSLKSYRATFETASYGTTINERTMLVLTGRAHNVKSTLNYKATKLDATQLENAIAMIRFEGLKIDHLYK